MATIAIVGGSGKIARHLHPRLIHAGHLPRALVRRTEQAEELASEGVEAVLFDIERDDDAALRTALDGADAIVFSAGGGPDGNIERKRTVDLEGSLRSISAARELCIDRFVQVSAIGADNPVADDASDVWRAYVAAKRDADAALRDSSLLWTILRPGRLTDDEGTGLIELGTDLAHGDIPRDDVAATIAAVLNDNRTVHQQWDLISGQTPILDAVSAFG